MQSTYHSETEIHNMIRPLQPKFLPVRHLTESQAPSQCTTSLVNDLEYDVILCWYTRTASAPRSSGIPLIASIDTSPYRTWQVVTTYPANPKRLSSSTNLMAHERELRMRLNIGKRVERCSLREVLKRR